MHKPDFVYIIYIATTPEKLWNALLDGEITRQYWKHRNVSDWKPGSRWEHRQLDQAATVDIVGKVVESDPPRRLVFTWSRPGDEGNAEKTSRVTFDIEPAGSSVRLVVTHDELASDQKMLTSISKGWPMVLSNLKSYIETGAPIANLW